MEFLLGDAERAMLAGAAGGIVRWATLRHKWREGIAAIFVGSLCALYLGPVIEPLLKPVIGPLAPDGDPAGFASFVVGLGGISLSGFLLDALALSGTRFRKPEDKDDNS